MSMDIMDLFKPVESCKNEDHGCKTTCCCGEDMEAHSNPMNCGHTPVSMHWWYCVGNCDKEKA